MCIRDREEHEQFNRKIVASAPVGICILRTADGVNILSNELAHTYLNMLTHEDRQRLTQIICGQQVNFVEMCIRDRFNGGFNYCRPQVDGAGGSE